MKKPNTVGLGEYSDADLVAELESRDNYTIQLNIRRGGVYVERKVHASSEQEATAIIEELTDDILDKLNYRK